MNQFTGGRNLIKTFMKYAPVQVFNAISVFFLISIQTKYLNTAEYGLLAITFLFMEIIRTVCSQWLCTSMLRLYPAASEQCRTEILGNVIFLTLLSLIASSLILAVVLLFYSLFEWSLFISLSFLLIAKSLFNVNIEISRLNEKYKIYSSANLFQSVTSVVFTLVILSLSQNVISAFSALAFSYALALIFVKFEIIPKLSFARVKNIIIYGFPLMVSGSIALLYTRGDRLFMPKYLTMSEIGIYAAQANLLSGVIGLIFMIVALPLYPNLVKLTNDYVELFKIHKIYLKFLLFISLPCLVSICMLHFEISSIFFGDEYISSSPTLFIILSIAYFLVNLRQHYADHGLQFLLKTNYLIPISCISLFISFFSLPFMLSGYGTNGAASTLLLTSLIAIILSLTTAFKFGYRFYLDFDVVKIILSSVVMGFFIFYLKSYFSEWSGFFSFITILGLSFSIYLMSCLVFNVFNARELLPKNFKKLFASLEDRND